MTMTMMTMVTMTMMTQREECNMIKEGSGAKE